MQYLAKMSLVARDGSYMLGVSLRWSCYGAYAPDAMSCGTVRGLALRCVALPSGM